MRERNGMPNRLGNTQIDRFIEDGFVKIEGAFPKEIAAQARSILWKDTGCDPDDPATWIKPVIRLSDYPQEPFRIAANTPVLHKAFDQLVGPWRWPFAKLWISQRRNHAITSQMRLRLPSEFSR
jgi:hypothetical protein